MKKEIFNRLVELTSQDTKSLAERGLKATEELGELSEAILSYTGACGCDYKALGKDDILEEGSDLLLVIYSILVQTGFSKKEIEETMKFKMQKWEDKIGESNDEI